MFKADTRSKEPFHAITQTELDSSSYSLLSTWTGFTVEPWEFYIQTSAFVVKRLRKHETHVSYQPWFLMCPCCVKQAGSQNELICLHFTDSANTSLPHVPFSL